MQVKFYKFRKIFYAGYNKVENFINYLKKGITKFGKFSNLLLDNQKINI